MQIVWFGKFLARLRTGAFLSLAFGMADVQAREAPVLVMLSTNANGARIQKALDDLPPNGEVFLCAGEYKISQPLLLRHDDISLEGSGPGTILRLADGAGCPVVILGPTVTEARRQVARVRLANLFIDGNRRNQKSEHWRSASDGSQVNNNGVEIMNTLDAVVEHVTCCRCRSGGLVTSKCRRLRVTDFDAYDNQFDGLACYQTVESRFEKLLLHHNIAAGISLDLSFNYNLVTNALLVENSTGIFMRHSRDNTFKSVTISHSRRDGVFIAQAAVWNAKGWHLAMHTECTGNHFEQLSVNDSGGRGFRINDCSCTGNVITHASFLRNAGGGLSEPASCPVLVRAVAVH